jgi:hypothetical protein
MYRQPKVFQDSLFNRSIEPDTIEWSYVYLATQCRLLSTLGKWFGIGIL